LKKEFKDSQKEVEEAIEKDDKENEKTEEEEQVEIDQMITDLKEQEGKDAKKKKKKVRELKKKLREKLASKLEAATEDAGIQEQDLFGLNLMANKKDLDIIDNVDADTDDMYKEDYDSELEFESDEDEKEEESGDSSDEDYVYGDDELYEKADKKKQMVVEEPVKKLKKKVVQGDNPLIIDMGEKENDKEAEAVKKAKQWFQKDIFKGVDNTMEDDDDLDDDYDFDQMIRNHKKQGGKVIEKNKVDTKKDKKTEKS